jgi:predicted DsbA family dithiol-disulfide isomerase
MPEAPEIQIEVWSDVVCSWCYMGKRQLERAIAEFPGSVAVRWRSFELDPSLPADAGPADEELARRRGITAEEARAMHEETERQGEALGIRFDFRRARRGNTFDAHRVLHMAYEHGRQDEVKERLLAAYFTEGGPIGDRGTLAEAASRGGLDRAEVAGMLESDRYAADVRADEREAIELGITAVPFFVVDRRYGIPGAHPSEVLLDVIGRAWQDRQPAA